MDALSATQTTQASSQADSALSSFSNDFDQFLTLLTTQLQNQDPTDPLDTNEMTDQLVQFASVEQQIAQNQNLEEMLQLMNASSDAAAVSYLGKDVQVTGDITNYAGSPITFGYELPEGSTEITISILNTNGQVVRTFDGETSAQRHEIVWDGLDQDGQALDHGLYQFIVSAQNEAENTIQSTNDISGRVTGAAFTSAGPTVRIGEAEYALTEVQSVTEPPSTT